MAYGFNEDRSKFDITSLIDGTGDVIINNDSLDVSHLRLLKRLGVVLLEFDIKVTDTISGSAILMTLPEGFRPLWRAADSSVDYYETPFVISKMSNDTYAFTYEPMRCFLRRNGMVSSNGGITVPSGYEVSLVGTVMFMAEDM